MLPLDIVPDPLSSHMDENSFDPLQLQNFGAALLAWGATLLTDEDHSKKTLWARAVCLSSYPSPSNFRCHWTIPARFEREVLVSNIAPLSPAHRELSRLCPGWGPACSSEQLRFWAAVGWVLSMDLRALTSVHGLLPCRTLLPKASIQAQGIRHEAVTASLEESKGTHLELCKLPSAASQEHRALWAPSPAQGSHRQTSETQWEEINRRQIRNNNIMWWNTGTGKQGGKTGGRASKANVQRQPLQVLHMYCARAWSDPKDTIGSVLCWPQTIKSRFIRSGLKTYYWVRAGSSLSVRVLDTCSHTFWRNTVASYSSSVHHKHE